MKAFLEERHDLTILCDHLIDVDWACSNGYLCGVGNDDGIDGMYFVPMYVHKN